MTDSARAARVQVLIASTCVALLGYLILLGRTAALLIGSGRGAAVAFGIALLMLPAIGLWSMIAAVRAGFAHQRLSRLIARDGMELDVSTLPRRPSGRLDRHAADGLFEIVRAELHTDPDNWRRWYRLARAYDYAGDRARARQAMRRAVGLQGHS